MIYMDKKYTYDGHPARVVCVDRINEWHPVLALVDEGDGREIGYSFTLCGRRYTGDTEPSLIEVKPSLWVNVYAHYTAGPYPSRGLADASAKFVNRVACIEVKEGEGL